MTADIKLNTDRHKDRQTDRQRSIRTDTHADRNTSNSPGEE